MSHLYERDPHAEVVMLEETLANNEINQAISLIQSINQSSKQVLNQANKQSISQSKIDLDYVRRCLNELNNNQPTIRSQSVGPREELAYALQSLSNSQPNKKQSINQTINHSLNQKKNQHDRSLVRSFDANDTEYQFCNQSSQPINQLNNDCGDVIVAEDEIPKQSNNQTIKSINQAISQSKLEALENRLAYVSERLRQVQSNIQSHQSINQSDNQSTGPEDDQAWNIVKDKGLVDQTKRIRSKL